jgi:nitric oxide reductase subunit C
MSGTRLFFAACLVVSILLVVAIGSGTFQTRAVAPEAAAGLDVWRTYKCEGCHTLYGQGGAYAPDLTHIFSQRGDTYLREFLLNPGAFHPGQRIMPSFGLTVAETDNLLAFLKWTDAQDVKWPPIPLQVSGGGSINRSQSTSTTAQASADNLPSDPAARGEYWFKRPPAICATCHSLEPNVVIVGPSLAGVATRAANRVPGLSAADYIRNSIVHPGEFVVPGFQDVMQKNFGDVLSGDQINDLIAFLMTLK